MAIALLPGSMIYLFLFHQSLLHHRSSPPPNLPPQTFKSQRSVSSRYGPLAVRTQDLDIPVFPGGDRHITTTTPTPSASRKSHWVYRFAAFRVSCVVLVSLAIMGYRAVLGVSCGYNVSAGWFAASRLSSLGWSRLMAIIIMVLFILVGVANMRAGYIIRIEIGSLDHFIIRPCLDRAFSFHSNKGNRAVFGVSCVCLGQLDKSMVIILVHWAV